MDSLEKAVQSLRNEIYGEISGKFGESDNLANEKLDKLNNNLKTTAPELCIEKNFQAIFKEICSLKHVQIVNFPNFVAFTISDSEGTIDSHFLSTQTEALSSFSSFVKTIETNTSENGIPKYYFIENFSIKDGVKLVRYATLVTKDSLFDASSFKA